MSDESIDREVWAMLRPSTGAIRKRPKQQIIRTEPSTSGAHVPGAQDIQQSEEAIDSGKGMCHPVACKCARRVSRSRGRGNNRPQEVG